MLRVAAHELGALVAAGEAEGLVLLDGGDPADAVDLAGVPAVVVGRQPSALADVVAEDGEELDAVARAVEAHTEAAVALAVLLRGGGRRSVGEGLVAESATYSMLQAGADHRRWLASRRPPRGAAGDGGVDVRRDGDVLHLTIDRPARRNAFSAAVRDALVEALAVAAADPAVQVVLDGRGPSFCSGGDLDEFGTGPDPAAAHLIRLRRSVGRAIAGVADRVTVHVHGACVGAGVELAAFAGRVVARADSRFWLPEVSMGLVPGAGGTVSIPRRIGRQRTALLAFTGRPIDAPTALAWGLVDDVLAG